MERFVSLTDVDGGTKAAPASAIRLLEDVVDEYGAQTDRARVTLCDGTQFVVRGRVAELLKQIETLETP